MKMPLPLKNFLEGLDLDYAKQIWKFLEQGDIATDEMIDIIASSHGMKNQCSPDDDLTMEVWFERFKKLHPNLYGPNE